MLLLLLLLLLLLRSTGVARRAGAYSKAVSSFV
jgi:hypothetical protein